MSEESKPSNWSPAFIDVEKKFTSFVGTFRDGRRVEELIHSIPAGALNADFYFPADFVIAELKCIESDKDETGVIAQRIIKSYRHFGYNGSDVMGHLWRGEKMPEKVAKKLFSVESRPIIQAIQKANKQIRSTKILLNTPEARGLVLLANNQNIRFGPAQILSVISRAFQSMEKCHVDCVVYFTPNIYHDLGDGIAHHVWIPIYNVGSERFSDFVNMIGKSWGDFNEQSNGPYFSRQIGDDDALVDKIFRPKPITQFKK